MKLYAQRRYHSIHGNYTDIQIEYRGRSYGSRVPYRLGEQDEKAFLAEFMRRRQNELGNQLFP